MAEDLKHTDSPSESQPLPFGVPAKDAKAFEEGQGTRVFRTTVLMQPAIAKQRFSNVKGSAGKGNSASMMCKSEVRSMARARKMGLRTQVVFLVEHDANTIYLEQIDGRTIKEMFTDTAVEEKVTREALEKTGEAMAIMHDGGLVHGNMITSNVTIEAATGKAVIMDFSAAFNSVVPHEKAADIFDFERSFLSSFPDKKDLYMDVMLEAYRKKTRTWIPTSKKLAEARTRDRKRKAGN